MSTKSVLLIGATGPTGLEFSRLAKEDIGVALKALARRPEKLAGAGVAAVRGDVLDPVSLASAMTGVDAVVCILGTALVLRGQVTILSEGTKNIVAAMHEKGVRRLLCVTGMGAGDSRGHGGLLYDSLILPLILGRIYADKDRQEAVVRSSDLDWTLVRPAMLTDDPASGQWREITQWAGEPKMTRISRADVAAFLLRELAQDRYIRQTVNLSA